MDYLRKPMFKMLPQKAILVIVQLLFIHRKWHHFTSWMSCFGQKLIILLRLRFKLGENWEKYIFFWSQICESFLGKCSVSVNIRLTT